MAKGGIISAIHQGSLAEELELVPGDKIISINEQELTDIIDLSFALADEEIEMLIEHENGEQEIIAFEKEYASIVFITLWGFVGRDGGYGIQ